MKKLFVSAISILLCMYCFSQDFNQTKKWFLEIPLTKTLTDLHLTLNNDKRIIKLREGAEADSSCKDCFYFTGRIPTSDLGLETNPDSAKLLFQINYRKVLKPESKTKPDERYYNGNVKHITITYFFPDKKSLQNAYDVAEKMFKEDLGKKVYILPATNNVDGKKMKGIQITYNDNNATFAGDEIYAGKNNNDLFALIIERAISF